MTNKIQTNVIQDYANKNLIINGNFDFWQRGTSFTYPGSGFMYTADRWRIINFGGPNTTPTVVTRENFLFGQQEVPNNPSHYLRLNYATGVSDPAIYQALEDRNLLGGKTVTVSFWVRSSVAGNFAVYLIKSYGTAGSSGQLLGSVETVTTSWTKVVITFDVESNDGKTINYTNAEVDFRIDPLSDTAHSFDIAQVQIEVGNHPTEFEYRSLETELAFCQRYYLLLDNERVFYRATSNANWGGGAPSTIDFPVIMRVEPTVTVFSLTDDIGSVTTSNSSVIGLSTLWQSDISNDSFTIWNNGAVTNIGDFFRYRLRCDADF